MKKNECANMMVQYLFVQVCINIYMVSRVTSGTRKFVFWMGVGGEEKRGEH